MLTVGDTTPWLGSWTVYTEEGTEHQQALVAFCFFTVDATWAAPAVMTSPTKMNCDTELWKKVKPFSLWLLYLGCFVVAAEDAETNVRPYI